MRYSDNIDYLVSSIIYLGTHEYYWARSPSNLAAELSLRTDKLAAVFEAFPGLFRRSHRLAENGERYYALQARYAQRKGEDVTDPDQISYIKPLGNDKLQLLINFVSQAAANELDSRRAWISNSVAVLAAIVAAVSAVTGSLLGG
jgi:hypothetical protein